MFTVFLLVVLAITVVSFPLDRESDGANAEARTHDHEKHALDRNGCCRNPACESHRCG
nr:A superfamily conotoxin S1.1b precursor [Conus striatus]AGK23274.1 A superfamily conotoxin S1.1a precursor [Conus striatus]